MFRSPATHRAQTAQLMHGGRYCYFTSAIAAATSSVASFARLSLQENGRQMNLELSVEFQTQTSRGDAVRLDVRGDPYEHVYQSRTFQSVHVPLAARWSLGRTPVSGGFLVSFNGQFSSDFSLETERVPIDRHVVEDTFYVGFGLTGLWDGVRFGRWAIPLEARVVVNTQATTIERADAIVVMGGGPDWEMQINTGFSYAFDFL